jgi:hypothetical protein
VSVDQRRINIAVLAFDPDGKKIVEADMFRTGDSEVFSLVAETAGAYRLEVRSPDKTAPKGRYEIKVKELRAATEQDKSAVVAERLMAEGILLDTQATADTWRKAIEKYQQSIPLWHAAKDPAWEASALYLIGNAYINLGEKQKALDAGNLALPLAQAAAFEASERGRARSLLELLKEADAEIRQGVDPSLLERERILRQSISEKADRQMRLRSDKHTEDQAKAAAKEIDDLTTEHEQVQAQIRQTSPRYAALTEPVPLSLKQIQTEALDPETLLLEYALGEEKSFLWAVTPTSIKSFELPKHSEIDSAARRVYEILTARNQTVAKETPEQRHKRIGEANAEYAKASLALSQVLLGPVAVQMKGKRLVIVGEGMLQYTTFAALPIPDAPPGVVSPPLIADHEIISLLRIV